LINAHPKRKITYAMVTRTSATVRLCDFRI
jgi:hypothetical protein